MSDGLTGLLLLLIAAIPVAVIVALFMAGATRGRLRKLEAEVASLRRQVAAVQAGAVNVLGVAAAPSHGAEEASARATPTGLASTSAVPDSGVPPADPAPRTPPSGSESNPAPDAASRAADGMQGMKRPPARVPEMAVASSPVATNSPQASGPRPGVEERFGTRWVVWIGGFALALGGVFLVQYSVEQGLVGPEVRIFLGALLAAVLLGAGEWFRRRDDRHAVAGVDGASIPSILTAAGTVVAFATVYAAYAVYQFLDPLAAFALLSAVAIAALVAALVHGPWLAVLGLVGAYATPALVASDTPNYWALAIYIVVVTAATLLIARARRWRWLAFIGVVLSALWILPGIGDLGALPAHSFQALAGFALVAVFIVSGLIFGPEIEPGRIEVESSGALAVYVLAGAALVPASFYDPLAFAIFATLVAATLAVAWRSDAAVFAVPAAAVLVMIVVAGWSLNQLELGPSGFLDDGAGLAFGTGLALLFAGVGYAAQGRSKAAMVSIVWAGSAVLAPIAILIAVYHGVAGDMRSIPFAVAAFVLAVLYAAATDRLQQREPRPGSAAAVALFAAGAVASLALGLTFALEKGWLSVGFALMTPGLAWIAAKRPLPALRWLTAALVVLVLARIVWEPRIAGADLGTTPIFNWLLYGYGIPAISFWVAGAVLRRRADDVPTRIAEAGAILFTILLVFVEIRHAFNAGDLYRRSAGFAEIALQVSAALALAIGLEKLRERTGSVVHEVGALATAGLGLGGIVFGLGILANPCRTNVDVGGPVFNLVMLGYLVPAILAAILAWITRHTRPIWYRAIAVATATGLGLLYVLLEISRLYRGPILSVGLMSDAERYTHSAATLAVGVIMLVIGILLKSQIIRFASAAVVLLAVGRVFLIDLSDLTGVYRALSFIGLGLALVGIGWLYQRLLFRPPASGHSDPA